MSVVNGVSARTLQIRSSAIPQLLGTPVLEPVRLSGREGLNALFEYQLLLKTPDVLNPGTSGTADFDLDSFIGHEISCLIQLDGAGESFAGQADLGGIGAGVREINALITDAQFWGEEGRHLQYKLTLRPWLHLATLNADTRIFQNLTVVELLDELLGHYDFPTEKRLIEAYPARDFQTQYNESDFEFFSRLCQEWGINYFFEHSDGKHRLVLIDNLGWHQPQPSDAYREVAYHTPGWKTDAEYIHAFAAHNQLASGRYAARDYDYTRPKADLSTEYDHPRPTGQAHGEVYHWHANQGGSHYVQPRAGAADANDSRSEGNHLARLRMEALRTHASRAHASGNLRGMVPGCTFRLHAHPREAANASYLVLSTDFLIEDVAQDSQRTKSDPLRRQRWRVNVDFVAHPVTEPLRPTPSQPKPHTHGPQVALVVGPEGESIWTDDLGRIKVQFPWDRIGTKDQHSSCWIRVSGPWAGNQLGGIHIPRIGQEVVVDFIGGDPDLPICTGRVHNQSNLPPWALPQQSALSGFRSRELTAEGGGNAASGRSNHLVLDDTSERIQAQLKSDHRHSQLSLGHIARIEDHMGRKDPRGQGFELRTDGHGVLRAKEGLLITTEERGGARLHMLDSGETLARLVEGHDQHDQLSDSAQQARAHEAGDQDEVVQALKDQNDAIGGSGGDPTRGEFPELAEPHLVMSSPAGIETTTPRSTHLASGEHMALTSGAHTSISARKSLLVSARQAIRMFAFKAGIRLVAGSADIDLTALKNGIHLLAKLDITLTAEKILIKALQEVEVNGGGSYSRWNKDGIEHGTSGSWIEYASLHSMQGPRNRPVPAPSFPEPAESAFCKECLLSALAMGSAFAKA